MFFQNLLYIIRVSISVALLIFSGYLFLMSIVKAYKNFNNWKITKKAAIVRAYYSSGSVICAFIAAEVFVPNIIFIPLLFIFLGVVWLKYLIDLAVIAFLKN